MLPNKQIFFSLILIYILTACIHNEKPVVAQPCKSIKLSFICSFDAMTIDSFYIAKYSSGRSVVPDDVYKTVLFTRSKEVNSNPVHWFVNITDSILKNESFAIRIKRGKSTNIYKFERIIFDTLPVFGGHVCGIKSYTMNGIDYKGGNFFLPDLP